MAAYETKRVINGTWGSVWVDSEKINECYGLQATVEVKREAVKVCGDLWEHNKMVGCKGKGTIKMNRVSSRFVEKIFNILETGKDAVFEIQSMLEDPDALGLETIVLKNVTFDELSMQNWEAEQPGTYEVPFSFAGSEYTDKIDATV